MDTGASASGPGSREPSQQVVSAANGFDPSRDGLWPLLGYAPGSYMGRCHDCGEVFTDLDKRASQCLGCAIIAAKTGLEQLRTIQAGERERREALRVLVDRLPAFSGHWSPERVDQWFRWFFDLLSELQRRRDSDGSGEAGETACGLDPQGDSAGRQASPNPSPQDSPHD